jgi:hypothetical protein
MGLRLYGLPIQTVRIFQNDHKLWHAEWVTKKCLDIRVYNILFRSTEM